MIKNDKGERKMENILFWMFVDAPVHLSAIKSHVFSSSDVHAWLTEHLWREQITHASFALSLSRAHTLQFDVFFISVLLAVKTDTAPWLELRPLRLAHERADRVEKAVSQL